MSLSCIIAKKKKQNDLKSRPNVRLMSDEDVNAWAINEYYPMLNHDESKYVVMYEFFDPSKVNYILTNHVLLASMYPDVFSNHTINHIRQIKHLSVGGVFKCYYRQPMQCGMNGNVKRCNRYQSYRGLGLQGIKREVRNFFCEGILNELDMKNAHPFILCYYCENNNIPCVYLKKYAISRELYLAELMEAEKITRNEAKTFYLGLLYGEMKLYNVLRKKPHNMEKLVAELQHIRNRVCENFPSAFKSVKAIKRKSGKNPITSLVSYFCQGIENDILQEMIKFFTSHGYIHNVCSMVFDGLAVPINNSITQCLHECESTVMQNLNQFVKLDVKLYKNSLDFGYSRENVTIQHVQDITNKVIKSKAFEKNKSMHKIYTQVTIPPNSCRADSQRWNKTTHVDRLPPINDIIGKYDTLHICSHMGSGKTYQLFDYIKYNKILSVLIISFRKSLEKKYVVDGRARGINFVYYNDITDNMMDSDKYPYLVVQINSLWKVQGMYDLVVFDEISYTLDTFVSFCTNRLQVYNALKSYITYSKKVITMDAYISASDIAFIDRLRRRKSFKLRNIKPVTNTHVSILSQPALISEMITAVNDFKKIVVVSNSKTFLDNMVMPLFGNFSPMDVENANNEISNEQLKMYVDSITRTNLKVLCITSSDKCENMTSEEWSTYDVVMYSPTIAAGLSFDQPNVFDRVFAYFTNRSADAYICVQMLFRVRYPINTNIYVHTKCAQLKAKPVTSDEIDKYLLEYINSDKRVTSRKIATTMLEYDNFTKKYNTNSPFYLLVVNQLSKVNQSKNQFTTELLLNLMVQGYTYKNYKLTNIAIKNIDDRTISIKNGLKEFKNDKMIFDIYTFRITDFITEEAYNFTMRQIIKTDADRLKCKKFEIMVGIGVSNLIGISDDNIMFLIDNAKYHKFDTYVKRSRCVDVKQFIRDKIQSNVQENIVDYHDQSCRDYWIKQYIAVNLCDLLGFKGFKDFQTIVDINNEKQEKTLNYIVKEWKLFNLHYSFNLQKETYIVKFTKKSNFIRHMNKLLINIGRKLKRKRCEKKGKRESFYLLSPIVEKWII